MPPNYSPSGAALACDPQMSTLHQTGIYLSRAAQGSALGSLPELPCCFQSWPGRVLGEPAGRERDQQSLLRSLPQRDVKLDSNKRGIRQEGSCADRVKAAARIL